MMFLLLVLITIVASFNIVSTLTMIVTEKQKEIAILKAMGATRKKHSAHFHAERIDHRPVRNRHRHSTRLRVSLADPDILDLRCLGLLHLADSRSMYKRWMSSLWQGPQSRSALPPRSTPRSRPLSSNQWPRCATNDHAGLLIIFSFILEFRRDHRHRSVQIVPDGRADPHGVEGRQSPDSAWRADRNCRGIGSREKHAAPYYRDARSSTAGTVHFDGQDIFHMSEGEQADFRNRRIGFVFQFHHLLPEFTALENACMPALIQRRQPGGD